MDTKFLALENGRIAYDDSGSGPLAVCVPGMGDLRAEFRLLGPKLVEAGYRVVTMDVRGHGESSVQWPDYSLVGIGSDILALIRHLDAGPAVLIGNSVAGGAAVWAAVEAPEWVRSLVLIDPGSRGETEGAYRLMLKVLFARPWGPKVWQMYYAHLFPTRKPADFEAYAARLEQNLSEPGRMEALCQMMIASKAESEKRLPRVTTPTLVVMGTRDPDFKDPQAEASWVAGQTHATVEMIEGAGHYPQTEMADITAEKILDFLKKQAQEARLDQKTSA